MDDLDPKQIQKAVRAIYQYVKTKDSVNIIQQTEEILLQICFKKIPSVCETTVRVVLPVTLVTKTTDICLFVKDLEKDNREYSVTVDHFRQLLDKSNVNYISEIVPLKALKMEYQPYEAKKNLSTMYDVFLADQRIVRLLPNKLGKHFFKRKRRPVQVDLCAKDLKSEVDKALRVTQCQVKGRGSTSLVTVAHTGLDEEKTVDNVKEAICQLAKKLPGGRENIKNLYLKTAKSPALPIYFSLDGAEEVILPERKAKAEPEEAEEVSTIMNAKVRILPNGDFQIIKDSSGSGSEEEEEELEEGGDSDEEEEEDDEKEVSNDKKTAGTKRKSADVGEELPESEEDASDTGSSEEEEASEEEQEKPVTLPQKKKLKTSPIRQTKPSGKPEGQKTPRSKRKARA